ncbi:MAG: B12-binding domain-containing radical SAM protein, partial [Flavobacterium sp.]|nr:B12-binding domain-containing radical SAM protein [Flavobacterium sp.]
MKILLINPSSYEVYGGLPPSFQMPLGLAYIASVAEKVGYDVEIIDIDAENLTEQQFVKRIKEINPALVGITCTTPVYSNAVKIAEIVKKTSNAVTVLGGIHPTIVPEESIKPTSVDIVVKGEGEKTFVDLVRSIGQNNDLSKVNGIVYKKNGQIISTPQRELIQNLDEIPFPARHLFKTQKYTYPDSLKKKTFPIITSRGCPGRCTFCNTQHIFGHRFRARSAKNVVEEIELLINKYGAEEIHIWDDNFTTDKKRVFEIRDELKKKNIKIKFAFPNGLRADFLNEEILTALKEMGTYSIAVGVESGSQDILNRAKKGIKLEKIAEVVKAAKKLKLETWAFFMFGLPGETKDTIDATIDFAKKIDPDIAKFHILKPFPGTEVYHYLLDNGLIISKDYDKYGIH